MAESWKACIQPRHCGGETERGGETCYDSKDARNSSSGHCQHTHIEQHLLRIPYRALVAIQTARYSTCKYAGPWSIEEEAAAYPSEDPAFEHTLPFPLHLVDRYQSHFFLQGVKPPAATLVQLPTSTQPRILRTQATSLCQCLALGHRLRT